MSLPLEPGIAQRAPTRALDRCRSTDCSHSPASASISLSSVLSCRSIAGSSIGFARGAVGLRSDARRRCPARVQQGFAKSFMARHGIPTARYRVCDNPEEALAVVGSAEFGFPVVVKADGLAAGKGVVIATIARKPVPRSRRDGRAGSATPGRGSSSRSA